MCGIAGFFKPPGIEEKKATEIWTSMTRKLIHRGPDDSGIWVVGNAGIALAIGVYR